MKEFIEKLIGRLEEKFKYNSEQAEIWRNCSDKDAYFRGQKDLYMDRANTYGEVMRIVNQLAEEYKNQNIDQDLTIVESLPSLYPMQPFEIEAIYKVVSSAKHSGGWIPCSERLPEEATVYEVTEEIFINSKKQYIVEHRLFGTEGEWLCPSNRKVLAWQPLPEAFKPEGE